MVYAGVDLHKRYSVVTLLDEEGKILSQEKLSNNKDEIIGFFEGLGGEELKVVTEATFNWYWFDELLSQHQIPLKLAHPLKTKAIASARIKTDKIDSETLAQLLWCDLLPEAYIPTGETRSRRELIRNRAFLKDTRDTRRYKGQRLFI